MTSLPALPILLLHEGAVAPARSRRGDAAYDLYAHAGTTIPPGGQAQVGTGVAVAVPEGHVGLVMPRSGLGVGGLVLGNLVGVIDPGYRGELTVCLWNRLTEGPDRVVAAGDRIAQLLLMPCPTPPVQLVKELPAAPDDRGSRGFGSSGA